MSNHSVVLLRHFCIVESNFPMMMRRLVALESNSVLSYFIKMKKIPSTLCILNSNNILVWILFFKIDCGTKWILYLDDFDITGRIFHGCNRKKQK